MVNWREAEQAAASDETTKIEERTVIPLQTPIDYQLPYRVSERTNRSNDRHAARLQTFRLPTLRARHTLARPDPIHQRRGRLLVAYVCVHTRVLIAA